MIVESLKVDKILLEKEYMQNRHMNWNTFV